MHIRNKILNRRGNIKNIILSHNGITTKDIAVLVGVTTNTVLADIKCICGIQWRGDRKVYVER